MWRWLLSSFFVPSWFIRVRLEFAFTFCISRTHDLLFYDHFLPPKTIWMNGDVAVAPLVFFRLFSVGFSFIRVSLEFAFTFCILHLTYMTYYSMTLFCLHKPFGSINEFWWLVLFFLSLCGWVQPLIISFHISVYCLRYTRDLLFYDPN